MASTSTSFPNIKSNLPEESQRWARDGVEAVLNELLTRIAVLESADKARSGNR